MISAKAWNQNPSPHPRREIFPPGASLPVGRGRRSISAQNRLKQSDEIWYNRTNLERGGVTPHHFRRKLWAVLMLAAVILILAVKLVDWWDKRHGPGGAAEGLGTPGSI